MDTPEGNSRRSWSGPRRGSGPRGTAGGTRATVLGSLTIPRAPRAGRYGEGLRRADAQLTPGRRGPRRSDLTDFGNRHQRRPAHQVRCRWRDRHHRRHRRTARRPGRDHRRRLGGHPRREGRPVRGRGTRTVPGPAPRRPVGLPQGPGRHHGLVSSASGRPAAADRRARRPAGRRAGRAPAQPSGSHKADPALGRGDTAHPGLNPVNPGSSGRPRSARRLPSPADRKIRPLPDARQDARGAA